MRTTLILLLAIPLLLGAAIAVASPADTPGASEGTTAQAAFERLKGLEGEWHGKSRRGNDAILTYQVIAGGNTVMEEYREIGEKGEISMHTLYHLDGEALMLTHYCISANQPRMRADLSGAPEKLQFDLVDVTNLASPAAGHMARAVLELKGADRLVNAWTYRQNGKDQYTETIEWQRRR
ncbi:MAG TPA: hypothetical protein VHQ65_06680 [Thermoanaerobaculia bacterium]|nr:hypothetical protein [Thermoanaerobaculia bacterium]